MHDELRALESGLDALETKQIKVRNPKAAIFKALSPLFAVAFIVLIWQIVVSIFEIENYILPSPREVASALGNQWECGNLQTALTTSTSRGSQGFIVAILLATPIGL